MKRSENRIKSLKRGFFKKCPMCGNGPLFSKYIKTYKKCKNCGVNLAKFKSDDGPAYCTIFLVGHLLIPMILLTEKKFSPPISVQMVFWPIITIILTLWLLPKIKGAFIAFQIFVNDSSD